MTHYYQLTEIGDPEECQFPLRRKSSAPNVEVPPELRFMAAARTLQDIAPLLRALDRYPELRTRLCQALKEEGAA